MTAPEDGVLGEVVAAFVRSIRAMGYYDESHPVFEATRREAHTALQGAFVSRPVVTLGCGGHHLIIDEDGTALSSPPAAALARRLFDNAVVAIRLLPQVRTEDLGVLMQVLAEREDRIREAGGPAMVLGRRGAVGVEVVEVDIDALFSGRHGDFASLAAGDPVAELALKAMLRFRDAEHQVGGEAVRVRLSEVNSAGALGGFLEDLLGQAEPGVVEGATTAGSLAGDDLADLASQAFLRSHDVVFAAGDTSQVAESAQLLSNALVRLSPDSRFALLRKLAGAEDLPENEEVAVRDLGARLDDQTLTSAIAAALFDQQGDPATVRSVGNLIRRVRPVEAERHRLLADVDADLRQMGRPIDGVLWQEMQSRALDDSALGLLEMNLAATRDILTEYAQARRAGRVRAVRGQDVLHTVDDSVVDYWTTNALTVLLTHDVRLGPATEQVCLRQLESLDAAGAIDECNQLLQALMQRADRDEADGDEESGLSALIAGLLEGPQAAKWSVRLLQHTSGPSAMLGEVLLTALDRPGDRDHKEALLKRLAAFDADTLLRLTTRYHRRVSPLQAQSLIAAALRNGIGTGVKAARSLLRSPTPRVRDVVVKSLVARPDREVVALIAHVAGWKGDKYTRLLLGLDAQDLRGVHRAQLGAIGALGLTHSRLAVRPLIDILERSRLFGDKEQDEQRVTAVQALRTNATPEAQQALREAARHKKRVVRDSVLRVLGKGGAR